MSDYISRRAALDALGVTKNATKYGGDHSGYDTRMLYEIHDALTGIPDADVVPVVRCKDCLFFTTEKSCCRPEGLIKAREDDFCSYGERRKE